MGSSGRGIAMPADMGGSFSEMTWYSSSWRMPSMSSPSVESCSSSSTARSSGGSSSKKPCVQVSMRKMALRGPMLKLSSMLAK